jgi:hypothetical protein
MRNLEKSYVNELPVLQFGREHLAWERGRFGFGGWLAKPVESDDSSVANGRVPGRLQWQWSGSRIEKGHYHSTLRRFRTPRSSLAGGLQH